MALFLSAEIVGESEHPPRLVAHFRSIPGTDETGVSFEQIQSIKEILMNNGMSPKGVRRYVRDGQTTVSFIGLDWNPDPQIGDNILSALRTELSRSSKRSAAYKDLEGIIQEQSDVAHSELLRQQAPASLPSKFDALIRGVPCISDIIDRDLAYMPRGNLKGIQVMLDTYYDIPISTEIAQQIDGIINPPPTREQQAKIIKNQAEIAGMKLSELGVFGNENVSGTPQSGLREERMSSSPFLPPRPKFPS